MTNIVYVLDMQKKQVLQPSNIVKPKLRQADTSTTMNSILQTTKTCHGFLFLPEKEHLLKL